MRGIHYLKIIPGRERILTPGMNATDWASGQRGGSPNAEPEPPAPEPVNVEPEKTGIGRIFRPESFLP